MTSRSEALEAVAEAARYFCGEEGYFIHEAGLRLVRSLTALDALPAETAGEKIKELEAEVERGERRYLSAVEGRRNFRNALRTAKAQIRLHDTIVEQLQRGFKSQLEAKLAIADSRASQFESTLKETMRVRDEALAKIETKNHPRVQAALLKVLSEIEAMSPEEFEAKLAAQSPNVGECLPKERQSTKGDV